MLNGLDPDQDQHYVLVWVQTFCKDYQVTIKVTTSRSFKGVCNKDHFLMFWSQICIEGIYVCDMHICLNDDEAIPGGYLFPCSPEINWLVPLFPKNRKFVFLCSLFPNIVFVPLFPSKFGLCSPEINALFPLFPKTPGRAWMMAQTLMVNFTRLIFVLDTDGPVLRQTVKE